MNCYFKQYALTAVVLILCMSCSRQTSFKPGSQVEVERFTVSLVLTQNDQVRSMMKEKNWTCENVMHKLKIHEDGVERTFSNMEYVSSGNLCETQVKMSLGGKDSITIEGELILAELNEMTFKGSKKIISNSDFTFPIKIDLVLINAKHTGDDNPVTPPASDDPISETGTNLTITFNEAPNFNYDNEVGLINCFIKADHTLCSLTYNGISDPEGDDIDECEVSLYRSGGSSIESSDLVGKIDCSYPLNFYFGNDEEATDVIRVTVKLSDTRGAERVYIKDYAKET